MGEEWSPYHPANRHHCNGFHGSKWELALRTTDVGLRLICSEVVPATVEVRLTGKEKSAGTRSRLRRPSRLAPG